MANTENGPNRISRRNLLAGAAILGGIGVSCGMGGLVSVLSNSGETANPENRKPQAPDHKAPMTTAPSVVQRTPERIPSATELLVASEQASWRNLLGRDLEIPLPPLELLQTMKYANSVGLGQMEPHFIPDLSVSENDNYPGWKKKPGYEFWQYIPTGNFEGMDGARFSGRLESNLTKKWILVDPILSGIGQYSHTDLYNRELPRLANRLHVSQEQVRLPTALEYNVLGNTHYSNWDDSTQREWFHETSIFDEGGSYPQLHAFAKGGSMIDKTGGLAHVDLVGDVKNDYIGYRPMVVFS